MSIAEKMSRYRAEIKDRWHTPGHKGALWLDDITEIGGDGEYFPAYEIETAEKIAAKIYGAAAVRFLTGGSSMGVKAAVLSAGGDIIAGVSSHRSVFEAAKLARVKVYTIENEIKDGLAQPLTQDKIAEALEKYPSAKAVVIESPDYYGKVCSKKISGTVKERGKLLIADSAHGAHFAFCPALNEFSFASRADFCNMSAHKTLFALTSGAYLAVNNQQYLNAADENLKLLGTTSPLYPVLSSLEQALYVAQANKDCYDRLKEYSDDFKKYVKCYDNDDFTRIVIDAANYNLSGKELYGKLFGKGISAEKYTAAHVVFIATPADGADKFDRLKDAVLESV